MESVTLVGSLASVDNVEDNLDSDIYKPEPLLPEAPDDDGIYPGDHSSGWKSALNSSKPSAIGCLALNDNKAGMEGLDRDKINKIINEASKGSKFYENERKKEEILNAKIKEQKALVDSISASQLQFGCYQADQLLRELEETRDLSRTIVHVDMDAFYAAVEMRDDPSLKTKPMAVGSMSMLSTSNYIARRFGIRAAMPGFIGRKLCPDLVIIPLNFEKYIAASDEVRQVMALYDPNFVPASLDEAYLDFTEHLNTRITSPSSSRTFLLRTNSTRNSLSCKCDLNLVLRHLDLQDDYANQSSSVDETKTSDGLAVPVSLESDELKTCSVCQKPFPPFTVKAYGVSVEEAVLEMRNRIEQRTHLTASAGIAPNTMLAKVCSDKNKPNGQFRVGSAKEMVEQFIAELSVRKIPGIGRVTEKLLEALGVLTCSDLYNQRGLLYHVFSSKTFQHFMDITLGIGSSTVERDGERKSMSTEQTFGDLVHPEELYEKCEELCHYLARDLKKEKLLGNSVTLKIKTVNFEVKTRTNTITNYSNDERTIFNAAKQLLKTEILAQQPDHLRLRLMGVRMSKLVTQADCSTSVASYFGKLCTKNIQLNEAVTCCTSPVKDKYQNGLGNSESRTDPTALQNRITPQPNKTIPQCFSAFNEDKGSTSPQKTPEKNVKSKSSNLVDTKTETEMSNNNVQPCMKDVVAHKQVVCVDFLLNKVDDCQLIERKDSWNHGQPGISKTAEGCDVLTKDHVNQTKSFVNTVSVEHISPDYHTSSDRSISSNLQVSSSVNTDGQQHDLSSASREMQKFQSTSNGLAVDTSREMQKFQSTSNGLAVDTSREMQKLPSTSNGLAVDTSREMQKPPSTSNGLAVDASREMQKLPSTSNRLAVDTSREMQKLPSTSNGLAVDTSREMQKLPSTSNGLAVDTSREMQKLPSTSNGLAVDASREMQKPPSTSNGLAVDTFRSTDMIQCPVCGHQKYKWPLDQLNAHVDLCLSRSTVRDILQDQQSQHLHPSVSKKRSRQDDENSNCKHSRNQRTLLSFFKQ